MVEIVKVFLLVSFVSFIVSLFDTGSELFLAFGVSITIFMLAFFIISLMATSDENQFYFRGMR